MAGEDQTTAVTDPRRAEWEEKKKALTIGERGVQIENFSQLMDMAAVIAKSGFAPGNMEVEQVAVAIQTGLEVGVSPMMAVRNMAVIEGRPSWMGKGALAIVRASGLLESTPQTRYYGELDASKKGLDQYPDDFECEVTVKRVGDREPQRFQYSVADAKLARLWGKTSKSGRPTPWCTDPKRMMYWRALGQALDSVFSDVLLGLPLEEVARDFITEDQRAAQARVVEPADEKAREEAAAPKPAHDPLLSLFEDEAKPQAPPQEPEEAQVVEPEPSPEPEPAPEPEAAPAAAQERVVAGSPAQASLLDGGGPEPDRPCAHQNGDGSSAVMYEADPTKDDDPGVGTCTICGETNL